MEFKDEIGFQEEMKFVIDEMKYEMNVSSKMKASLIGITILIKIIIPIREGTCLHKNGRKTRISLLISSHFAYTYNRYLYNRKGSFLTNIS